MSGSDNQENLAWQANKSSAECHRYVAATHSLAVTNTGHHYIQFSLTVGLLQTVVVISLV